MSVLLQDIRFAARVLVRARSFSLLAILTVALGVGASTTVFSLLSATVLRPPAGIAEPDRVVQIGRQNEGGYDSFAFPYVRAFAGAESLQRVAGYTYRSLLVGAAEGTEVRVGQLVTGDYFSLLGTPMVLGRALGTGDEAQASAVVVISETLWRDRFGGAAEVVGSELRVNGRPHRVVGVVGAGFRGTDVATPPADLWLPLPLAGALFGPAYAEYDRPGFSWLWVLGRLAETATVEQARGELDAVYAAHYAGHWGEAPERGTEVVEGPGLRPEERSTLAGVVGLLLAIVAAVMLVASANLGSLMLARGMARSREMGIRVAIGASRVRLVRQLLTESVLLSLAGGAVALIATVWTARLLPALIPWRLGVSIHPDANVLWFGVGCSVLVGLLFGGLPALRASAGDVAAALRDGSARAGFGGLLLRRGLVVGQLALAFALLVLVALLGLSLREAGRADPGFDVRGLLAARIDLDLAGYEPGRAEVFRGSLLDRVRGLPGVRDAALGTEVPFAGWSRESIALPEPLADGTEYFEFDSTLVSDHYFDTLGIRLVRGPGFTSSQPLPGDEIVLSERAVGLLFPDSDPIGGVVPVRGPEEQLTPLRVVGVAADIRQRGLRIDPRPAIYLPATFRPDGGLALFVRADGDPLRLESAVRTAVAEIDPDLVVLSVAHVHERMGGSLGDTRLVGRLAAVFGALALALAAVGLYGVIAYLADRRRHEVGVRMALGAATGDVLRLIARQGLTLGVGGLLLGLGLAVPSALALRGLLYGVSPQSPFAIGVAALLLVGVTLLASLVPARRATRVDPARALRAE